MSIFRKHNDNPVFAALRAQSLVWLAEAMVDGGIHMVSVISGPDWLEGPRLMTTAVTPTGAEALGRALAVTHAAGTPAFGAAPPEWDGRAQIDRSDIRLRPRAVEESEPRRWGEFYAEDRVLPYLQPSWNNDLISVNKVHIVERLYECLHGSDFDTGQPALIRANVREHDTWVAVARTHKDLQYDNALQTPADEAAQWAPRRADLGPQELSPWQALMSGATGGPAVIDVPIDPMAQGARARTDLAALGVFEQHYLDRIYAAYHEVSPPAGDQRERVGLHSWRIIMVHAFLFGRGYGGETATVACQYL